MQERAKWAPRVATGSITCWRCGKLIAANAKWHMGHSDRPGALARGEYMGPEHQACSTRAGRLKQVAATRRPPAPALVALFGVTTAPTPAKTLGPPRAGRRCEICNRRYTASRAEQRTCSRACGVQLKRRNRAQAKALQRINGAESLEDTCNWSDDALLKCQVPQWKCPVFQGASACGQGVRLIYLPQISRTLRLSAMTKSLEISAD